MSFDRQYYGMELIKILRVLVKSHNLESLTLGEYDSSLSITLLEHLKELQEDAKFQRLKHFIVTANPVAVTPRPWNIQCLVQLYERWTQLETFNVVLQTRHAKTTMSMVDFYRLAGRSSSDPDRSPR